jgi:hypothetical protein
MEFVVGCRSVDKVVYRGELDTVFVFKEVYDSVFHDRWKHVSTAGDTTVVEIHSIERHFRHVYDTVYSFRHDTLVVHEPSKMAVSDDEPLATIGIWLLAVAVVVLLSRLLFSDN